MEAVDTCACFVAHAFGVIWIMSAGHYLFTGEDFGVSMRDTIISPLT